MILRITPTGAAEQQEQVKKEFSLALITPRDKRKFDLLEKKLKLAFNKIEIPQEMTLLLQDFIVGHNE